MEAPSNKNIIATTLDATQYLQARNIVMHELQHESELFTILKEKLKIDLRLFRTISKSVNTYLDSKCFYRLIFDSLLVTSSEVQFIDRIIPYPLISKYGLYTVGINSISNLLRFLEEKYTYVESFSESQEYVIKSSRSFIRLKHLENYGILPLLGLEAVVGMIMLLFPLRLWLNLMLINSLLLGGSCLIYHAYYLKRISQLVMRSVVPYQKMPLHIELRHHNLMQNTFTRNQSGQFSFEYFKN
jgi:hypothetical protein